MKRETAFHFSVGKASRALVICLAVIGLSHLLVGGCGGGGGSSSGARPAATIVVTPGTVNINEGETANLFTITLSKPSSKDITIAYTVAGTATVTDDHDLTDGTVTIPSGTLVGTLTVTAVDDADVETIQETIEVTLIDGDGYKLGDPAVATGLLIDNDTPNTLPVTVPDTYDVDENGTLDIAAAGVLTNDTDVDFDPLTAVLKVDVSNGTLTLNADGSFTYAPTADFFGVDTFDYAAADLDGEGNTITVTINVNRINDVPVAVDDIYAVTKDQPLTVAAAGVLANDSDPDNYPVTPLEALIQSSPSNGSVTLNADGSFTYTPNAGFFGPDSFTYTAYDGANESNIATVTIIVNAVPVANDDTFNLSKKVSNIPAPGVLLNDTDADGDPLTAILIDAPLNGTVTVGADGSFQYKAFGATAGTDSFTYKVNDGLQDSNTATVYINPVP